ncbi:hypothetical protein KDN34_11020 [Shewanella yunxiaonensis]|uniref:Competence protein n=1 Tax=Shewanella yunxiaonensis TaxID=2829809 RepID=A0ABX7YQ67_9GAMM|nr:hypothetical protein [Shewanella yunxiaonensis]QUN04780.1 hypothetical protein KDN34_11020 [Shewanella yunxiaonensis]
MKTSPQVKMTYARHISNKIVSINDDFVASGKACDCICLDCGSQLIAKKKINGVRAYHFAHHPNDQNALNCSWTGETELHFRVKEYLFKTKAIKLPIGYHEPQEIQLYFEEVMLEEPLRQTKRIPDVIGITQSGERIIFEVRVTHEVDAQKRYDYRRMNVTSIEIRFDDVHSYLGEESVISDELISNHLMTMPFEWLSIGPSGEIAEKYHAHEREQLKNVLRETGEELKRKKSVLKEINETIAGRETFLRNFEREYSYKNQEIERIQLNILNLTSQIQALKIEKDEILLKNQHYVNERVAECRHELFLGNEEYRKQIFLEELSKHENELSLLEENRDTLKDVINAYEKQVAKVKSELGNYEGKISIYKEEQQRLDEEKLKLRQEKMEQEKLIEVSHQNARVITEVKRNLERIEKEVRPLCKQFGIPWPLSHNLLVELER